jgi:hypothetical protein
VLEQRVIEGRDVVDGSHDPVNEPTRFGFERWGAGTGDRVEVDGHDPHPVFELRTERRVARL